MTVPVFVNCRDRLEPLIALLDFLDRAGHDQIVLLDNDSAYSPLLELFAETEHRVIRLGRNAGRLSLWDANVLAQLGVNGRFVFTDPDVVPIDECPLDAVAYFDEILDAYPDRKKVGFGLKIDDLSEGYRFKDEVVAWESQFWEKPLAPRIYDASIDTTFALYRGPGPHTVDPAIRTGYPYVARHVAWYLDENALPSDERFYRARAEGSDVNHWSGDGLPAWLTEAIAARQSHEEHAGLTPNNGFDGESLEAEPKFVQTQLGGRDVFDPVIAGGSVEPNPSGPTKDELIQRLTIVERELHALRATKTFRYTEPIRRSYERFRRPPD